MSNQTVIDEQTTVAGVGAAIARHARSYGIDIAPICEALDINPEDLSSLTARISLDRMCRLLEACAILSNDEAFGLKCGAIFTLGASGPFGYGMITAPTVRDFLEFLNEHLGFASQVRDCRLEWTETDAVLSWTFSPLVPKRDQYVDLIMTLYIRHLRRIINDEVDAVGIGMQRLRPANPALYRERLTRQISYGMPLNSLHIPVRLADLANPNGDQTLFKLMDIQLRALQAESAPDEEFVEQVRRYIRQRIAEPTLALDAVASYFGLSERTFQRRLAEFNTTLNDLRDEERRGLSLIMLRESGLSISTISYRLGYSAPSAFTRSVYRWFGASPKTMRCTDPQETINIVQSKGGQLDAPAKISKT